jgi:hypothetical protein
MANGLENLTDAERASCSKLATCFKRAGGAGYAPEGELTYASRKGTKIDTITIHCWSSIKKTAVDCCNYFYNITRRASCNYAVANDGTIGICVPEIYRSFCSGGDKYTYAKYGSKERKNDYRAVTVEVSCHYGTPNTVDDIPYNALIILVADICKRNGIKRLIWSNDPYDRVFHRNGCNMTVHRDYNYKSCPGNYLYERMGQIAGSVNNLLDTGVDLIEAYTSGLSIKLVDFTYAALSSLNNYNIMLKSLASTETEISTIINVPKDFSAYSNYKWTYQYKELGHTQLKSATFKATSDMHGKGQKLTISNLHPGKAYSLEVLAESTSGQKLSSAKCIINTKPDYPDSVNNIKFELVDKNAFNLSFSKPSSWGSHLKNSATKGYRISLIVNGEIKGFNDNLIKNTNSRISLNNILLSSLTKNCVLNYTDTIQIGVQTFVKYGAGEDEIFFDSVQPRSSPPVFLSTILTQVDKIYIEADNTFNRTIIYNSSK